MELPWGDLRSALRPGSRSRGYRGHHRRPGPIARAAAWPRWPGHVLYKRLDITSR
jgi:hypothetical protein